MPCCCDLKWALTAQKRMYCVVCAIRLCVNGKVKVLQLEILGKVKSNGNVQSCGGVYAVSELSQCLSHDYNNQYQKQFWVGFYNIFNRCDVYAHSRVLCLSSAPLQCQQCATLANVSLEMESANVNRRPATTTTQTPTQTPRKHKKIKVLSNSGWYFTALAVFAYGVWAYARATGCWLQLT